LQALQGGCQLPLGVYYGPDKIYAAHATTSLEPAKFFEFNIGATIQEITSALSQ
jgi:hypothetical protein